MTEAGYTVTGMVCAHCAASVTEEISILGVSSVTEDIDSGRVVAASNRP
ncbi:heavy-metal-associated domain-containing protein [Streptomyces sp. CA-142005]